MKIILQEVVPRGFLSNYTTILTSFKGYIEKEGIDPDDILVSSSMFSLYGNPKNWFDHLKVREKYIDGDVNKASTEYYDFDPWPTDKQLDLSKYLKYFSYNDRVLNYLDSSLKPIEDGFGIHFRGTDHSYHVNEVPLEKYFKSIKESFNKDKYKTVFICSDEEYAVEQIKTYFKEQFNFFNIIVNDVTRSKTKTALHLSNYDLNTKVRLGDEVLLDSHSLASCQTIIGKTSNLISYARILNPTIEVLYQDIGFDFRK